MLSYIFYLLSKLVSFSLLLPAVAVPSRLREAGVCQHCHVSLVTGNGFQVDGLCAMVEGVQDLVAKAEQISAQEFVSLFPLRNVSVQCIPSAQCLCAMLYSLSQASALFGDCCST